MMSTEGESRKSPTPGLYATPITSTLAPFTELASSFNKRETRPTFEDMASAQTKKASEKGVGDLKKLLYSGDLWDVK